MIIHSFSLALAIIASLLCLVFLVMAIQATRRNRRSRTDVVGELAAERDKQERMRMAHGSGNI